MNIKLQLKTLLNQKGVNITTLARTTKIPAQTIHSWLTGAKPRDLDQLKRVADYFGVSLDFIAYGTSFQNQMSPIEQHKEEINAGVFEVILRKVKK